jgi:hypothetical protein
MMCTLSSNAKGVPIMLVVALYFCRPPAFNHLPNIWRVLQARLVQ